MLHSVSNTLPSEDSCHVQWEESMSMHVVGITGVDSSTMHVVGITGVALDSLSFFHNGQSRRVVLLWAVLPHLQGLSLFWISLWFRCLFIPVWAYKYAQGTRQVSSRKPRGDPAEDPAEHPRGTCRPSGPRGLEVRHRALRSQPHTAIAKAGGAIRTLVPVTSPPRPPLLRGRTYVRTYPGASRGYSYVHGTEVTVCTGDLCYAEVGFNRIMDYVLQSQPSEKTNALSLRDKRELRRTTDTGQYSVLRRLRKICKRTQSRLAPK
jgi:hypothetical protein